MLETLSTINWSQLTHAHGSASDVPGLIRNLVSSNEDIRKKALWELYGNIFHQGTRYQATPYAVPFFYELLTSPDTPDRHEIVYLLVSLALGYENIYLPDGLDAETFRRNLEDDDSKMTSTERAQHIRYGSGPRINLACYDAVQHGALTFIELLNSDDLRLRCAAIYALAWFPENAIQSLPAIRQLLKTVTDDIEITNALLTIGLLTRSTQNTFDNSEWHHFLLSDALIIRVAAAIAVAGTQLEDDLIDILVSAVLAIEKLRYLGEDMRFNHGNMAGYASLVLARCHTDTRQKVIPVFCEALKSVNPYQSLDITESLLHLITGNKIKLIKDMPLSSLDPLDLTALRAIADFDGWKIEGGIFVNYWQLVCAYGLPESQDSLNDYLNQSLQE